MDDQDAGLKRGEFVASIRQLTECFNWSIGAAHRFLETLLQNSMIMRVEHLAEHPAEQEAGHFNVCNYETYNSPRYTERNTLRNTERNTFKEVLKESKNKRNKRQTPAVCRRRVSAVEYSFGNLSAKQPIAARGEGAYFRKTEEVPVKD